MGGSGEVSVFNYLFKIYGRFMWPDSRSYGCWDHNRTRQEHLLEHFGGVTSGKGTRPQLSRIEITGSYAYGLARWPLLAMTSGATDTISSTYNTECCRKSDGNRGAGELFMV